MPPPALGMIVRRRFGALVWTRSFSNSSLGALLERLSGHMGSESAKLELKWMREELRTRRTAATSATSSPSPKKDESGWELGELRKMVDRRLQGEPLQYILGEYGPTQLRRRHRGLGVSETTKRPVYGPSSCRLFTSVIAF